MRNKTYLKKLLKKGEFNPMLYTVGKRLSEVDPDIQDRIIDEYLKHPNDEVKLILYKKEHSNL